jgi:hypothetical protein
MTYYNILELKKSILKSMPIINQEERDVIRKIMVLPILAQRAIDIKEEIAFGKKFTLAASEKTIKSLLPDIDLKAYESTLVNNEDIVDVKVHENLKSVYVSMNESNGRVKKESKEERALRVSQGKTKRFNNSEKMIDYANEIFDDNQPILIFDIEAYERQQSKLTEIGYLIYQNGKITDIQHLIIEENIELRNKKFVKDNKDNFNYGNSKIMSLDNAISILVEQVEKHDIIMGQSLGNDINYLKKHRKKKGNKDQSLFEIKKILDTSTMSFYISKDGNPTSIERGLEMLEVETKNLHNAGNDCYYTLEFAKSMISYKKTLDLLNKKSEKNIEDNKNKKIIKRSFN